MVDDREHCSMCSTASMGGDLGGTMMISEIHDTIYKLHDNYTSTRIVPT